MKKEINCSIKHGKLIVTFYGGFYRIKRIKKGTKTIISESIEISPEIFQKIKDGQIFKYRYFKVAIYSELMIIRDESKRQRIVIYNEEIAEIKKLKF
ncbi:hypothetical protein GW764_02490 [Candidatus Parcubacteria bacterium]|nr:hypothetical protein [Candidatus Parcubacteria bacterium]